MELVNNEKSLEYCELVNNIQGRNDDLIWIRPDGLVLLIGSKAPTRKHF